MDKKKILYIVGAILAVFILYHVIFTGNRTKADKTQTAPPPQAAKPKQPAEDEEAPVVLTEDQKQINEYTDKINAGQNENGNAFFQRGLIYLKTNQYRQAVGDFTKALAIVPKSPYVLYNRALAYREQGDLNRAIADLNAAIQAKPDFADALNARGLIYVDQQDYNSAESDYNDAIKINPKSSEIYFNLGTLYARQGKADEAIKAFTQAIDLNVPAADATPEQLATAKRNLGQAYLYRADAEMHSGDTKTALDDANYVVKNYPQSVEALRMRAAIYDKMGNPAAAAADNAAADSLSMQNMMNKK